MSNPSEGAPQIAVDITWDPVNGDFDSQVSGDVADVFVVIRRRDDGEVLYGNNAADPEVPQMDDFLRRADGSIYGRRDPTPATQEYETAYKNLDALPYPHFDGSGCRVIDLGSDVYGLVDFDAGVYRVGLYWNLPEDDGGVCAEFQRFEDLQAFTSRLSAAHAPVPKA